LVESHFDRAADRRRQAGIPLGRGTRRWRPKLKLWQSLTDTDTDTDTDRLDPMMWPSSKARAGL